MCGSASEVSNNFPGALGAPADTGYTYEIYGNPTFADLGWHALPFALSSTGTMDQNKHTAISDGSPSC